MKIAVFSNTYRPFVGGVTRSIDTFVEEFRKKGHEVQLFVPRFKGVHESTEWICRVSAIPRFNQTDFSLPLPFSLKVRTRFKEFAPDVVHVQHPFFLGEMGMHLGKYRRLPLVLTYHTQYEQYAHYTPVDTDLVKRWIINVCTSFCDLCDLVIAPSRDLKQVLIERGVRTPIEVIPTGIDLSRSVPRDTGGLRKRLELGEETKILVHVGRFGPEKNLEFLFRSVAKALVRRPALVFYVAGEGTLCDPLKRLARQLGMAERVYFEGKLSPLELSNVYADGDLFVFASKTETQGLVVLEAMAAGMPVVAVDAPGVRDMVEDGLEGFLTPENGEIFAERILFLLDHPERWTACAQACRIKAEAFSASRMAERMLLAYERLRKVPRERLNRKIHHFTIVKGLLQEALRRVEGNPRRT